MLSHRAEIKLSGRVSAQCVRALSGVLGTAKRKQKNTSLLKQHFYEEKKMGVNHFQGFRKSYVEGFFNI